MQTKTTLRFGLAIALVSVAMCVTAPAQAFPPIEGTLYGDVAHIHCTVHYKVDLGAREASVGPEPLCWAE